MRLTGTSYAILGLLAIKPWSTYELAQQMNRSLYHVWPRATSNVYEEPRRLVTAGFATADQSLVGRRPRTVYSITPAGQAALDRWLAEPSGPTLLESEAMIKVLFGNRLRPDVLIGHLDRFAEEAEAGNEPWRALAREYIEGRGPFPDRIHVNALFWVLLDQWARLRSEWARWAAAEVERWPDGRGPLDKAEVVELLERALSDQALPRRT
jgi:DNA-binding PadR family transcriptional regulator